MSSIFNEIHNFNEAHNHINLPVATTDRIWVFPMLTVNLELNDGRSVTAINDAVESNSLVFMTCFASSPFFSKELPAPKMFGTVCRVLQSIHLADGGLRVTVEGLYYGDIVTLHRNETNYVGEIATVEFTSDDTQMLETAYCDMIFEAIRNDKEESDSKILDEINFSGRQNDLQYVVNYVASTVLLADDAREDFFTTLNPVNKADFLLNFLNRKKTIGALRDKIQKKVEATMNKNQQDYYLREQIKAMQNELGDDDDGHYAKKIKALGAPKEVTEKLLKECEKLKKSQPGSPESAVISTYLDICLEIPWKNKTEDTLDYKEVARVLDEDHSGLEKVKERIVEYIAAKQFSPNLKNQILCLVGAPGIGKTSIAYSIAKAMNRAYVRVALGGVRDEADIRGHRKTYVAAMPGRIINALIQAKSLNPFILLDEIDKLTRDAHGDPTSALLEVLDAEQNKYFRDHFVELPVDLSDVFFLTTANTLSSIPKPLIDRMEIIELDAYTREEKLAIAKEHLIAKQAKRHGLEEKISFTDGAIYELIDYYTHEAGVRNLEREIATICRKVDKKLLDEALETIEITEKEVTELLGARKILPEKISEENEVGIVNGLAWTEVGGTLLKVETAIMEGTGVVKTTGSLGDVMKESSQIAMSYVRTVANDYAIPADFYKTKDIHIHFPEGATPKDGPSAGVTMTVSLISALTGRPVRKDVAMTGELTLNGKVLAIGGLREKTMAAYAAGVKTVFIPEENVQDLEKLDPVAKNGLEILPVKNVKEILDKVLL